MVGVGRLDGGVDDGADVGLVIVIVVLVAVVVVVVVDVVAVGVVGVAEHDVAIEVHGGFGRPPKPMTPEAEALFELVKRAGADLGQQIAWKATGGVCDGNNIAACGVPVVDTMGVRGGKIHSMEEFLIVESLSERAALSALTILRLLGEPA